MKILAPAGNLQSLKLAVFNGADEVYLGVNDFNARNNIDGFTIQTLKEAVDFAHLFNVRVLLALNILILDSEMQNAIHLVHEAYCLGVDAFIVQDLGLASLIRKHFPLAELHASTQMGVHNLEGARFLQDFGFRRVVLARETPLDEIKRIKENCSLEIEYFAHGALCVGFSGNCFLSSYLHSASGNRGKCKQLCRLPYTLKKGDVTVKKGYLLSAKDFNLIDRLNHLKSAGVDCLKIEGRARRPYYVAVATREYYNALHGKKPDKTALQLAFNRNFTEGYFNGNGGIISNIQSHVGILVGKVERVNTGNKFTQVVFSSNRPLSPKSTFKFFDGDVEKNVLTAYDLKPLDNGKYALTTTQKVQVGNSVRLIVDSEDELLVTSCTKKRKITINLAFVTGEPAKASFSEQEVSVQVEGAVCIPAKNQPLTVETVAECFNKSELFETTVNVEKLDDVFLTKKQLNDFRRDVLEQVYMVLTTKSRRTADCPSLTKPSVPTAFSEFEYTCDALGRFNAKNVVLSPEVYSLQGVQSFVDNCVSQSKTPYLDTPNFVTSKDFDLLKNIVEKTGVYTVANNYYALAFNNFIIGGGLNVFNSWTANFFNRPFITAEDGLTKPIHFPYMTLRHCPIKSHVGGGCDNCLFSEGYCYHTESGKVLRLRRKKLHSCTFYLTD